ncbi:ATP12 family protein [Methylorubrum rhodesianum]|uniref:ATP12 family chaperone protein n=1 Tax=Methylorubrum TaxID=2282523 RepID=UPI00161C8E41|nr:MULTISPECIES: ATP12 family protein [Methylorubrum]MBB5760632.1 chaperone required for assembly of F1-ATPase [Methylorubrum rhodesianum]MBI1689370.1 ATPase [Methylorubrum sp. DB1722]
MSISGDDVTRDWLGEPGEDGNTDPVKAARASAAPTLPKRFYGQAAVAPAEGGFRLVLDGRGANTPGRRPLVVPDLGLGEALAAEWAAQEAVIDPRTMPLTRLVNTTIDGVVERRAAVAEDLGAFAGTDLVAYRAGTPERLVAEQAAAWDPLVDWAAEALGARLFLAEGVMHVEQPEDSVAALRAAIDAVEDPFRLAALHALTTLTGSLVIALAVLHRRLSAAEAWAAAHVDESYQASIWGRDAEAEARLAHRRTEFEAAAVIAQRTA